MTNSLGAIIGAAIIALAVAWHPVVAIGVEAAMGVWLPLRSRGKPP